MADNAITTKQQYQLGGETIDAALEWADVKIIADYENNSIQPELQIDSLTFTRRAREIILQWIANGNIFEGLPLNITLFNNKPVQENFKSVLNFTELINDFPNDGTLEVAIQKERGLISFFDNISGLSLGYLENIGVITDSDYEDIEYVVEKKVNPLEIVITSIVIYLLIKEVAEAVSRTSNRIAQISAYAASGLTGTVGAAIFAAAAAIIEIAYTAILVGAIINLTTDLLNSFLPPKRTHKAIRLRKMLERICQHFGLGFETNVDFINNVTYLPSNQNFDELDGFGFIKKPKGTQKGIPSANDRGYIASEVFEFCKQLCDGKYAIINNTVLLYPEDDPFWITNSTYVRPNVLLETKSYNTDELISTIGVRFITDSTDDYTLDNFQGTVIDVKTDIRNPIQPQNNLLKGFEDINIGLALGSRKNELTAFEKLLKSLGSIVDDTTDVLGKKTNFANKVKTRLGLLKVSTNNHVVPKLLYAPSGKLNKNHREIFNAKTIWENYYGDRSFVRNNFRGQKAIYRGVRVPFGFEDYKKLTDNSYFTEQDGSEAKIIKFEWLMESDEAIIDFWVREIYTKNLTETIIEA